MEILDCVEKTQVTAGISVAEDMRGPGNSGQRGNMDTSAPVVELCLGTLSLPCGASGTHCPGVGDMAWPVQRDHGPGLLDLPAASYRSWRSQ